MKNPKGGRPRSDYLLTLDVAKEVAMIGNTPKEHVMAASRV